jgi:hypothetical protein
MMDYACFMCRSAARCNVWNLQALQSKCLRIATDVHWYIGNGQIHEDFGISCFVDYITALSESFDPALLVREVP